MSDVWTPHVSNPNMPPISSGEKACESWQPGSAAAVSRSTTRDAAAPPAFSCFKRGASSAPAIGFPSFRFARPNLGLGLAICSAAPDRCHDGCARAGSIEMREIKRNGRPRWLGLALLLGAALVLWPGADARADDSALAALKESDDLEQQKMASVASALLPVIEQTVQPPTTSDCYRVTSLGGTIKQTSYGLLNGYAAMVPAGQIDSLALG